MACIKTVSEHEARGIQRLIVWQTKRQYGYLPGIVKILMPDVAVARRASGIYTRSVPLTRGQLRESVGPNMRPEGVWRA